MIAAVAELVEPGIVVSLGLGLASIACIFLTLLAWRLDGHAAARFTIWFVALVALALALPAFFAGAAWLPPAPLAIASEAMPREVSAVRPLQTFHRTAAARPTRIPSPSKASAGIDPRTAFLATWAAGILLLLARAALGLIRLRALVKSATLLEVRATARGTVRVLTGDLFAVPIAVGYRHPAVILPANVLALERETDLENIVLHELEHLRRFDDITSLVQVLCMCVLWFNPFAYLITSRLSIEREMACDEGVVACNGKRVGYAATLWKMATCSARTFTPEYLSAFRSRSATVPRLDNLLNARPPTPRRRRLWALAAAAVLQVSLIGVAIAAPVLLVPSHPITAFSRVRLLDGETLVVGGRDADGTATHFAQLYDRHGRRLALIATSVARWAPTATLLQNGDVLVLGGVTAHGASADAEIYEAATHRFRSIAPMDISRVGHTATLLLDGRVLVASGERTAGAYVDETEIYDPHTERFVRTADGDGRVNQNAVLIDRGSVLMYGGRNATGSSAHCVIIYDPALRGYRSGGRIVKRTPNEIVTRLATGRIIRHVVRSA